METRPNIGHVLVLEDEPFNSLDMEEMLRGFGAESVTVFDTMLYSGYHCTALIWRS